MRALASSFFILSFVLSSGLFPEHLLAQGVEAGGSEFDHRSDDSFDRSSEQNEDSFDVSESACARSNWPRCSVNCDESGSTFEGFMCRSRCINSACSQTGAESSAAESPQLCLMKASEPCSTKCEKRDAKANCRRDCLRKSCQQADPLLVAEEARSPGTMKCRSCSAQHRASCNRLCSLAGPEIGGLGGVACRKICLSSRCESLCLADFTGP